MNDRYRLTRQITAITIGAGDRTLLSIPSGSSITVMGPAGTDDRLIEIIWGEDRLRYLVLTLKKEANQLGSESLTPPEERYAIACQAG
jgi:hypothetical protein